MSNKIGVAIIGAGIIVRDEHLPAVLANGGLSLKAIYSRTAKAAQALVGSAPGVDVYSNDGAENYDSLLARSDISGVIIALPIVEQSEYTKRALAAGKHVLAEKPLAKDVATANELLEWYHQNVDTKAVQFAVAEQYRYLPEIGYAAEKVKSFGRVLGFRSTINYHLTQDAPWTKSAWRANPKFQGGFVLDSGVHFAATMRALLPKEAQPTAVSGFTSQLRAHLPPIDTVDAALKLANGSTGLFSFSMGTSFFALQWDIACEGGTVKVEHNTVTSQAIGQEAVTEKVADGPFIPSVIPEVAAWAESLKSGVVDQKQSPREALADLEIMEAMIKSGESGGQSVALKLQTA